MRYLSVCSGIEAASVAWRELGWQCAGVSEIEAFPRAVLEQRQGAVAVDFDTHRHAQGQNFTPMFGDFTQIEAHHVGSIDLLVGGTPCQSFSIAGLRGGLDDDRGNLALEFLRLAQRTRPRWLVWENVPGVLSSNGGRDFGAILGGMVEIGYGVAYRVLDAQYFGVAQRRRRVFAVGYFGDWRRSAAVLFERESLCGSPAPSRRAGKVAPTIPSRSTGGGGLGTDFDCDGGLITNDRVAPTLDAMMDRKFGSNQWVDSGQFVLDIAHTLRANYDASEDGTGRGTPIVPVAFDTTQITSPHNYSNPKPGDPCHPLAAGAHPPAIAFSAKDYGADAMEDVSPTLRAGGHSNSHQNGGVMPAIASSKVVRRLTPVECERLQGFPDNYTQIEWRKKPADQCPDGPRYKALGNSMAVPVMRWIGERIALVDAIPDNQEAAA